MKHTRFWKIYAAVTASALLLIAAALAVFYDYISTYERSQPLHAVEDYAASLTDDDWRSLIFLAASEAVSPYETADIVTDICCSVLEKLPEEISCEQERTASGTMYRILRGDTPLIQVTLETGGKLRYGFSRHHVASAAFLLDELPVEKNTRVIYAPKNAEIRVNGVSLPPGMTEEINVPAALANPFEERAAMTACMYTLSGLYGEPEILCTLDGKSCTADLSDGTVLFFLPDDALLTCTFTAPAGSAVTLNGIPLGSAYCTSEGTTYSAEAIEENAEGLPTETVYTVTRFHALPTVSGTFHGVPLEFTQDGTDFRAEYPDSLLYGCRITAPAGSDVTIRGISCTKYRSGIQTEAYPGLFDGDTQDAPMLDVYDLQGLYLPPEDVCVRYRGNLLLTTYAEEGKSLCYAASFPEADAPEAEECALTFARDYFTYVSSGYQNTEENLNRVLANVLNGSALASTLLRSKSSISFVTPVTFQEYKTLSVRETRALSDDSVLCILDFAIHQKIYYIQQQYSGTVSLVCTRRNNTWSVSRMLLDARREDIK